jgi:hypothetical protein
MFICFWFLVCVVCLLMATVCADSAAQHHTVIVAEDAGEGHTRAHWRNRPTRIAIPSNGAIADSVTNSATGNVTDRFTDQQVTAVTTTVADRVTGTSVANRVTGTSIANSVASVSIVRSITSASTRRKKERESLVAELGDLIVTPHSVGVLSAHPRQSFDGVSANDEVAQGSVLAHLSQCLKQWQRNRHVLAVCKQRVRHCDDCIYLIIGGDVT